MATRANDELAELRQTMARMGGAARPAGEGLAARLGDAAGPLLTKALGYAELAQAVLPQLRALTGRRPAPAPEPGPPPAPPQPLARRVWGWAGRRVPVRMQGWGRPALIVALAAGAGLAAYGGWRLRGPRPPVRARR